MSDWYIDEWVECDCGRGHYDPNEYTSCFECYMERREDYLECIFCGRWHSPKYGTCFRCRQISPGRDEAGRNLRLDILIRDNFTCSNTRCGSREQPEVDHIKPCFEGGAAAVWNLQVLCRQCNQRKGRDWYPGSEWDERRVRQMHLYFTFGWSLLDEEQQCALVADAAIYGDEFTWHTNWQRTASAAGFCHPEPPEWAIRLADTFECVEVEAC